MSHLPRKTGDVPFIMGQLMVFRRACLGARERLAEDEDVLVDDERDRVAAFECFAGLGALPEGGAGDEIVVADGGE